MNAVSERLAEAKVLSYDTSVRFLIGITWCSVTGFFGPFGLIINTEHVRHMESDGATVNYKGTLERVKNIALMANNSFQYLYVSNYWNITSSYKNLLRPCYNYDAEGHIRSKLPLPCNEGKIKRAKEAREASHGSGSGQCKGIQHKNEHGK